MRRAALLVLLMAAPAAAQTERPSGAEIYAKHCASCHDQTSPRVPPRDALTKMSPARILPTLDFGLMMSVAYPLRRDEREAVAAFLGTGPDDTAPPAQAMCKAGRALATATLGAWTGWSPSPANTRFQPVDQARLSAAEVPRLELKWAFGFPGDVTAFAAPTVLGGTLFVGSAAGSVQALDAKSGCIYWVYKASGPVRSAMTVASDGRRRILLFSDQNGSVYAVDARSGEEMWKTRVEAHEATRLTGGFALHDGLAFVPAASWEETRSIDPAYKCCTFRGSVTAVRVRDGSVAWKTHLVDMPAKTGTTAVGTDTFGPSGAGVWSAPTVDASRGVLYITTGDNYSYPATATSDAVMALDLKSGRIVWSRQTTPNDVYNSACGGRGPNCPPNNGPDFDFGSSAMLVKTAGGRDVIVAGQKSGVVYGLDPNDHGRVLWQTRVGAGGTNGGVQWGMASDGRYAFAAVSDVGRQPGGIGGAAGLGNAPLHPTQGGGLTALNVLDGSKAWVSPGTPCAPPRNGCSPAQPAAVTAIPGVVFSGAMDGHLRAFSTTDGKLLWDVDTAKPYTTTNGVPGTGGSLDGAGPVVAGGMLFVNSGYPRFGGMPGNVLLAFAPASQSAPPPRVSMTFTPQQKENTNFIAAAEEYRRIWADEGDRVIRAMEQVTKLPFPQSTIPVEIYEAPSFSGNERLPMRLRASYPAEIKKGTLVHELGHRINLQLRRRPKELDEHRLLFLFLYDLWTQLYGKDFADREVAFERTLKGLYDYDAAWTWALAMTPQQRATMFAEVVKSNGK
jgi:polyvinyl alcohol dehydrogenase (cytochrome)